MSRVNLTTEHGLSTVPTVSSFAVRSSASIDVEHTRHNVLDVGAPVALIVLALSAVCCVVVLKWKIQDRLRRHRELVDMTCDLTSAPADEQHHQTAG